MKSTSPQEVLEGLLEKGTVYLHVNPDTEGVSVPERLKAQPSVILQIGYDMSIPIPDLHIDDTGVCATLSFSRSPFLCKLPWSSIFAMVSDDGKALLWPQNIPDGMLQDKEQCRQPSLSGDSKREAEVDGGDSPITRRGFGVIDGGLPSSDCPKPTPKRTGPNLHLVD
jgi:hypothetical protein